MKNKVIVFVLLVLLMATVCPAQSYYTGNGGMGISLEVDTADLVNMSKDGWISDFVVNTVTDDIAKYSAIQIVDVRNIGTVTRARARDEGATRNESQMLEAGKFSVAQYILNTSITGKPSSFAISIRVNNKADLTTVAAYSDADVSRKDLESGKALKEATVELLTKMGVSLTADGKKQLLDLGTESVMTIDAQKNIARAEEARKNGSTAEAISYYFKAAESDKNVQKALDGLQASMPVSLGNTEIERIRMSNKLRKEYKAVLEEMIDYYKKNEFACVEYSNGIHMEDIDYRRRTITISSNKIYVRRRDLTIYDEFCANMNKIEDSKKWGLENYLYDLKRYIVANELWYADVELVDGSGKIIAKQTVEFDAYWKGTVKFEIPAETDTEKLRFKVSSARNKENKKAATKFYDIVAH